MPLEKEKFRSYELDEKKKRDVISVPLNDAERMYLEEDKVALQQEKDATAIKELWAIGRYVIHHTPEGKFMKTVLENIRKNKRLGIEEVEKLMQQK